MDAVKARRILDELLRSDGHRPTTASEWSLLRGSDDLRERAITSPTPEEDFATDSVPAVLVQRHALAQEERGTTKHRRTTHPARPLSPPDWWEAESERRLRALHEERDWLRLDAGLDAVTYEENEPKRSGEIALKLPEPYALDDISDIAPQIRRLVWRQLLWWEEIGQAAWELGPEDSLYDLFYFNHRFECHEIEYPAETWAEDQRVERAPFMPAGMAHGARVLDTEERSVDPALDRLHWRSLRLAKDLGITQAECLAWALTDTPFTIPWIRASTEHVWTRGGEWTTVVVQINSESATAKEAAKAYTSARGAVGRHAPVRRARRAWPTLVVSFVDQRRRDASDNQLRRRAQARYGLGASAEVPQVPHETWRETFDAFASKYPEHPYKSVRTFANAYHLKKRESDGKGTPPERTDAEHPENEET